MRATSPANPSQQSSFIASFLSHPLTAEYHDMTGDDLANTLARLGSKALVALNTPAALGSAFVVLLILLIPVARNLAVEALCQVYVTFAHRPFQSAPIDYLFSGAERPLPASNSFWSNVLASTTLKWRVQRKGGLRHEKEVDWDDPDAVQNGDMIEAWDRIAEWDEQCLHPSKLEQLRRVGDPLADDALDQVDMLPAKQSSTDTLRTMFDRARSDSSSHPQQDACKSFWQAVNRRPPPGAGALDLDWYRARHGAQATSSLQQWPEHPSTKQPESSATVPIWSPQHHTTIDVQDNVEELQAEAEVLRRGKDVFYRYAGPILTVLLHFSLAGGFASPRITEVLKQTAYLVPNPAASRDKSSTSSSASLLPTVEDLQRMFHVDKARADRTWSRLLETTQFVLDVMENADSLRPPNSTKAACASSATTSDTNEAGLAPPERGGEGWQSAVRVRLLHTNVRRRVLKLAEKRQKDGLTAGKSLYDVEKNGVPINQEDLLGTLCAFSTAPLAMLQRIGVTPTAQERKDFIALWRHVGFYMGIEPALLRRAFRNPYVADRTLWCTILHLFNRVEILGGQHGDVNGTVGPRMQGPTIPVLIACAGRPPFHTPLSAHVAISRRLLGKSLADALALPAPSAKREVLTDIAFLGMYIPIWFGSIYPRLTWEGRKLELSRPLLRRLIVFSFGNKRTKFEMPSHDFKSTSETKARNGDKVNVETQSSSHLDVPEDKEHIMSLARQWRWLMREMLAILALAGLCVVAVLAAAFIYL